jgi:L-lactate dehydrogenase complex protein LldG
MDANARFAKNRAVNLQILVEKTTMTEREKILARVREALQTQAPLPGSHENTTVVPRANISSTPAPLFPARQWLPKVSENFDERLALFAKNAAELKADFQLFQNRDELKIALAKISSSENWQRIATHRGELTDSICDSLNLPICFTDKSYDVTELEICDAGISECDALIAQTGSVLVTSRSAGGRALSVLPPHHVVLARREQLIADLPAAFELVKKKYAPNFPSMISFITGPSRTGDIERILVLGAHGPKKLTILCY